MSLLDKLVFWRRDDDSEEAADDHRVEGCFTLPEVDSDLDACGPDERPDGRSWP